MCSFTFYLNGVWIISRSRYKFTVSAKLLLLDLNINQKTTYIYWATVGKTEDYFLEIGIRVSKRVSLIKFNNDKPISSKIRNLKSGKLN